MAAVAIEEPFGYAEGTHRLVFDPTGDLLAAARQCEADVFLDRYGNTAEQLADEYGPYEPQSVFLALVTRDDDVAAAVRFIMPGPAGLKTIVDMGGEPWHVDGDASMSVAGLHPMRTWDIATLSARSNRADGVNHVASLYHGIALATRANDINTTVAILDIRMRRLLDSVGLRFQTLPGAKVRPYLGSPASVPVFADIAAMLDNQRRMDPMSHHLFVHGAGLDGVRVPGMDEFTVTRAPLVVDLRSVVGSGAPAPEADVGAPVGQ